MALRVLLADDERIARQRLSRLLASIDDVTIVGEHDRGAPVVEAVRAGVVDVILLDIQMPGLSGLETARALALSAPRIIFCTAYPEHALAAFEVGAVDYLLKPIELERLRAAIERARRWLDARRAPAQPPLLAGRLALETREGVLLLDPRAISYASFDGALVTVHVEGRDVLTDLSLQTLAARLTGLSFVRAHRRTLLNLEHVALLEPSDSGGYVARTHGGHRIEISRQAARILRRALGLARVPGDP